MATTGPVVASSVLYRRTGAVGLDTQARKPVGNTVAASAVVLYRRVVDDNRTTGCCRGTSYPMGAMRLTVDDSVL